jgi:hypothetical protein
MTVLEYNSEIRTKTTYTVPILFGEPQYDKKKIFSYSIYDVTKARIKYTIKWEKRKKL